MRNLIIFFVGFFSLVNISLAQLEGQARIDSLLKELPKIKEDTNAVNLLSELSFLYYSINPDKGIEFGNKGLKISGKINWKEGEAKCYSSLGVNYVGGKSDPSRALEYFTIALKIDEKFGNIAGIARHLGNIGIIFENQSDYLKALEYYQKALKIDEKLNNRAGIARHLGNIGLIYDYQADYPKALEYHYKSLDIEKEMGNKPGISMSFANIGIIYKNQSDYPKAIEYFHKALKMDDEIANKSGIASNLDNLGTIYTYQLDYPKALEYYHKALKINEEIGNKFRIAVNLENIGSVYFFLSQDSTFENSEPITQVFLNSDFYLNKSIELSEKALKIYIEIGAIYNYSNLLHSLSESYKFKGNYKKAFEAFKEYKALQDSVFSMDKQKEIANLEAIRENELKDAEITILNTQKKAQQFQSYLLGGGAIVLLGAFW
ncbi:MAG: tetratricopeptide repeat protein [Candidatus Kapabacteria bacterium]|nr:tetratricopeptide repeat protein [Candidatus Kapabacteria bacterium]